MKIKAPPLLPPHTPKPPPAQALNDVLTDIVKKARGTKEKKADAIASSSQEQYRAEPKQPGPYAKVSTGFQYKAGKIVGFIPGKKTEKSEDLPDASVTESPAWPPGYTKPTIPWITADHAKDSEQPTSRSVKAKPAIDLRPAAAPQKQQKKKARLSPGPAAQEERIDFRCLPTSVTSSEGSSGTPPLTLDKKRRGRGEEPEPPQDLPQTGEIIA